MFAVILGWLVEWLLSWLLPWRWPVPYKIADRFEKLVNGKPIMQGQVVVVAKDHGVQVLTIEWDDGTRTTGKREDVLRSAREIHPLAPRIDRSARHS